jgi:hypothetical protein
LSWCAFKRRWKEENVEHGLYGRYGGFCEEAEEGLEEDVPEEPSVSSYTREIESGVSQNDAKYG